MNRKDPKQDPAFYSGRGPGRGSDIAANRGTPKRSGRGVAGEPRLEIDLNELNKPGVGPMTFAPQKGMDCLDENDDNC